MTDLVPVPNRREAVLALINSGDYGKLTPEHKAEVVIAMHEMIGLDPVAQAFDFIPGRNGKVTVYANRKATAGLAAKHGVSVEILSEGEIAGGNYIVRVRATDKTGRRRDDVGVTEIEGLRGQALGNKIMHAVTKASSRAVNGLCGIGHLTEPEVEDFEQQPPVVLEPPLLGSAIDERSRKGKTEGELLNELDKIAEALGASDAQVEAAILQHTGKGLDDLSIDELQDQVDRAQARLDGKSKPVIDRDPMFAPVPTGDDDEA